MARRGGSAVFLGRFTAFLQAMTPARAGLPHAVRVFLRWNAIGGLIWGTGMVLIGYLAGASYAGIVHLGGRATEVVAVVVVVGLLIAGHMRRRGNRSAGPGRSPAPEDDVVAQAPGIPARYGRW